MKVDSKAWTQRPVISISNLSVHFLTFQGIGKAVDDVNLEVYANEVVGVVGESGCGKSVTALSVLRLIPEPPGKIVSGHIYFDSIDLLFLSKDQLRHIRGNKISMIFQEPSTSLNPVFTIGTQIIEPLMLHKRLGKKEALENGIELLRKVAIPAPEKVIHYYPHQLSGGMKQRVMIAMALSCDPELLIADEPTTALDVTIQAQILDLMIQLKEEENLAVILISHNLAVIGQMAHKCIVMYAGQIVESGLTEDIFQDPKHPYTQGLLESAPGLEEEGGEKKRLKEIPGTVPDIFSLPSYCKFSNRCPMKMDRCEQSPPPFIRLMEGRAVRCWLSIK